MVDFRLIFTLPPHVSKKRTGRRWMALVVVRLLLAGALGGGVVPLG